MIQILIHTPQTPTCHIVISVFEHEGFNYLLHKLTKQILKKMPSQEIKSRVMASVNRLKPYFFANILGSSCSKLYMLKLSSITLPSLSMTTYRGIPLNLNNWRK